MRSTAFFTLILLALPVLAQRQVRFTDASGMARMMDLRNDKAAVAGLQAAGLSGEQQDLVLTYSAPDYWPLGLRTDSARLANKPYLQNYAAYEVCSYQKDSTLISVIMLPAAENIHMSEDLRPLYDIYLVMPDSMVGPVNSARTRPTISRGPAWQNKRRVKILKPDDLFATYDLGSDAAAREAMEQSGMSAAEIDAVIFRSHERNWPDGIDSFDERYPKLGGFKKYKAYLGARWDDKVLLIVPVEKNRKRPVGMRPYVDLYLIYNASAVEVKKK